MTCVILQIRLFCLLSISIISNALPIVDEDASGSPVEQLELEVTGEGSGEPPAQQCGPGQPLLRLYARP